MEGLGNLAIRIGNQREGKMLAFLEFPLSLRGVTAYSENLKTVSMQRRKGITQGAGLLGATRCLGFRVEINQGDSLPVDVGKNNGLSVLVEGGHLRSRNSHSQRFGTCKKGK